MERKSEASVVFVKLMDSIRNSVSFPYKWKFVASFAAGDKVSQKVMDLFGQACL